MKHKVSIWLSHYRHAGQNRHTNIAGRSFENVSQLKYLGMTITNQNLIQEEMRMRLAGHAA
jgi:hypothetical protein